jgi:hypothetical protein
MTEIETEFRDDIYVKRFHHYVPSKLIMELEEDMVVKNVYNKIQEPLELEFDDEEDILSKLQEDIMMLDENDEFFPTRTLDTLNAILCDSDDEIMDVLIENYNTDPKNDEEVNPLIAEFIVFLMKKMAYLIKKYDTHPQIGLLYCMKDVILMVLRLQNSILRIAKKEQWEDTSFIYISFQGIQFLIELLDTSKFESKWMTIVDKTRNFAEKCKQYIHN